MQKLIKLLENFRDFFPLDEVMKKSLLDFLHLKYNYNSNAIEWTTLTEWETAQVLRWETIPNHRLVEHFEVINHKKAFDFILEKVNFFDENKLDFLEIFTEKNILQIHKILLTNISDDYAWIYRRQNVRIAFSKTILPNYLKVPDLMVNFFADFWERYKNLDIKNYKEVLKFAYDLHLDFVKIHPFIDGNWRTARFIMNLWLLYSIKNINIIYFKNRQDYIEALEESSKNKRKYYDFMNKNFTEFKQDELELLEKKEIFKY